VSAARQTVAHTSWCPCLRASSTRREIPDVKLTTTIEQNSN
jgi:hypothetical protein